MLLYLCLCLIQAQSIVLGDKLFSLDAEVRPELPGTLVLFNIRGVKEWTVTAQPESKEHLTF
jgi:hypothetical protein